MRNLIFCLFIFCFAYSQVPNKYSSGIFSKENESLIAIEFLPHQEDDGDGEMTVYSIGSSFIWNGQFEFGTSFNIARGNFNSETDFTLEGFSFGGYYHFKENAFRPYSIKLGGYFGHLRLGDPIFIGSFNIDMDFKYNCLGGGIYKTFYNKNSITIVGLLNYHITNLESQVSYTSSFYTTDNQKGNISDFGFAIRKGKVNIILTMNSESKINFSLGLLLPKLY